MAASSSDERLVERLARALHDAKLEAIVVGATAAVLHGAPVTTQDVDLLVRRTARNEAKITAFRRLMGGMGRMTITADVDTLLGAAGQIDLIFDALPANLAFQSVRSRATKLIIAGVPLMVASLEDIIRSKRAAGRPKDHAMLPILEDTLRVKNALR